MRLSRFILIVLIIFNCTDLSAQDSTTSAVTPITLKRGIYFTYEAFLKNMPNISDSFFIEKDYDTDEDNNIKSDSSFNEYILRLTDSTKKAKKVFGVFDGKNLYLDIKRGLVIRLRKHYVPFDYIGAFPFIELDSKKPWSVLGLGLSAVIDDAISKKKHTLLYINKDGELSEATNTSIWFFLKKDKELLKEYDSEKLFNIETFKKYLIKMNAKYTTF